jgi:hypothetical protein
VPLTRRETNVIEESVRLFSTQIFGGYGFMSEFPVGRLYRDAKILEIGEGTSECSAWPSPATSVSAGNPAPPRECSSRMSAWEPIGIRAGILWV